DFVVEFILKEQFEFELQMYTIEKLDNKEGLTSKSNSELKDDSKAENDTGIENNQKSSYRELSSIPTTFKFTDEQQNWINIENENLLRWSVAVPDKSNSLPEFRLLAISFINIEDMRYYKNNSSEIHLVETPNKGATFVFIIHDDYSISSIDNKILSIEYGGIVKLFSEKDNIAHKYDNDEQENCDKQLDNDNQQIVNDNQQTDNDNRQIVNDT
ncbi:17346_t:CDS:2, partial [Racocetra persica]